MGAPGASQPPSFALPTLPELLTATVFSQEIRYYDVGHGPVLVLVHGVGGDADQWAFCLDDLAASHRVIAIDLLGFGRSGKPAIRYRIAGFVEVLERFLDALHVERASYLGHSLGGWIVATFALRHPQRVDRLILNDAVGIDAGAVPLPVDLMLSTRANLRAAFECMFHDRAKVTDDLVDLAYSLHLARGDGPTIHSVLETLADRGEKLDAQLGAIVAPTLVLWGEQDRIAPLAMGRNFQQMINGAQLHVIPACGHLAPLEQPKAFAEAVTAFLGTPQGMLSAGDTPSPGE